MKLLATSARMPNDHPLKSWIAENSTRADFARDVGCSRAHLSDILNWKKDPSLELAAKMSRATGGAVPMEGFAPVREAAE